MLVLAVALASSVAAGLLIYNVSQMKGAFGCVSSVRSVLAAPDNRLNAVVYGMNCGATAGFNTQVAVAAAEAHFSPDGDTAFLVLDGTRDVRISWSGPRKVAVELPGDVRIFRRKTEVNGVAVEYRQ